MRLQFQILTFFILSKSTVFSQNASLLSINATVGVGGTIAPVVSGNATTVSNSTVATVSNVTVMTTPMPLTTGPLLIPTVTSLNSTNSNATTTHAPTISNITVSAVSNVTVLTTPVPLTTGPLLIPTLPSLNATANTTHAPTMSNSTVATVSNATTIAPLTTGPITIPTVPSLNSTTTTHAPAVSNMTIVTTPAPLTTVSIHLNLTVPAISNVTTTPASLTTVTHAAPTVPSLNSTATTPKAPTAANVTGTTAKPSTKFPETCQSIDVLVQSGECYYALEGLDAEMGSSSLTDSVTIELLNGYCDTFSTCYPAIEKCADFDPDSISIIKGFCDFYQFVTSRYFLTCAQNMEGLDTPCTDNATATILNFNATTAVRCAKLTAVSSCTVEEVGTWCNMRSVQSYQMFINRHIQTWMC